MAHARIELSRHVAVAHLPHVLKLFHKLSAVSDTGVLFAPQKQNGQLGILQPPALFPVGFLQEHQKPLKPIRRKSETAQG